MNLEQNKFNLKIPQDISLIFSKKKKILTVIGPIATKSIKLKLNITIDNTKKILSVSPLPFFRVSNAEKKTINALRASTIAQIKHLFIRGYNVPLESRHSYLYDEFLERDPGLDKDE